MTKERGDLLGRTCIVTGAGSGLGAATAETFAQEGAKVFAVDRDFSWRPANKAAIEQIPADVGDASAPAALATRLTHVDVVACFAAVSVGGMLENLTDEDWRQVLEVNVLGTARWITPFLPQLRASARASIITVASQLAIVGGRGNPSYLASKGAILSLTRCLAMDYAPDNIRVNCIVPAAIKTPMLERSFFRTNDPEEARVKSLSRHALRRFGEPSEVAQAALFLASDRSSFTTGAILPVDGGWLAA